MQGFGFDREVNKGGYAWWYVDALSDDGLSGIVVIAFVGSVFSPYYAWSRKRDPFDHCAINVALYGPRSNAWTMTERGRESVAIGRDQISVGSSALQCEGGRLSIDIDELSAPIPQPVSGRIVVEMESSAGPAYSIDRTGRHKWRPIAPHARAAVDFNSPSSKWSGRAYVDSNWGDAPLEMDFEFWNWSRMEAEQRTVVFYDTVMRDGEERRLALEFRTDGVSEIISPAAAELPATAVWRMPRGTRSEDAPKILRTLEDTPFYSRSIIASRFEGETRRSFHESFSGARLRSPIVKSMLPFRMPRRG